MTLDLERIRAAELSRLCIGCQWSPPRHCGQCPCCRRPLEVPEGVPEVKYHFYRIWRDEKFYLFCRSVGTPNRSNAALYTEKDWLEWGQLDGLQREEAETDWVE